MDVWLLALRGRWLDRRSRRDEIIVLEMDGGLSAKEIVHFLERHVGCL